MGILDLLLCNFALAVTNAENRKKNGCTIYELYQVFGIANVALFDSPRGKLQLEQLVSSDFLLDVSDCFLLPRLKNIFGNEIYPIFLSGASDCTYSKFVLIRGPTLMKI